MKFAFLIIAIIINLFNQLQVNSEENINSANNIIENIAKEEPNTEDKIEKIKIHIVKNGDTISNISEFYSIDKNLIIKLNDIKDENYIFVGQNLIISASEKSLKKQTDLIDRYHIVQKGENLTEISNKHNLNLGYLIEINNLKNPDSIKVGEKLLLSKNDPISSENYQLIKNKRNNELVEIDKQIYGPIIFKSKSYKKIKGKKVLNVLNRENKKLILSINCDTDKLNVRIPGRKWRGEEPAKEEFEKDIINDFCKNI